MMASQITVNYHDMVAAISMNRSPVNAFDGEFLAQLNAAVDTCASEESVRVIVITSSLPGVFSAGADIRWLQTLDQIGCREFIRLGQMSMDRIEELSKPVIAAVNGVCVGGGCELAMACDLRLAGSSARFGQPEVDLGLIPGWGGTQRLPMLIGKTRSMELVMTGEQITAEMALSMGLVNQIGPDEDVLTTAMGLARRLACKSSASLTSIKKAVQRGHSLPLADGLKVEADCFIEAYLSQDFHEGINAFLDKRPTQFH